MAKTTEERIAEALDKHSHGYNCAQAVTCVFSDKAGMEEELLFRISEGMGFGMGCMEGTCGAIGASAILSGLKNSTVHLEHPDSKAVTYKAAKACLNSFKEQNTTVICRDLKGIDTGNVLRACRDCIADAVRIIDRELYSEESN